MFTKVYCSALCRISICTEGMAADHRWFGIGVRIRVQNVLHILNNSQKCLCHMTCNGVCFHTALYMHTSIIMDGILAGLQLYTWTALTCARQAYLGLQMFGGFVFLLVTSIEANGPFCCISQEICIKFIYFLRTITCCHTVCMVMSLQHEHWRVWVITRWKAIHSGVHFITMGICFWVYVYLI